MKRSNFAFILIIMLAAIMVSCSPSTSPSYATATPGSNLTTAPTVTPPPISTATPTVTPTSTPTATPTTTQVPPSATPTPKKLTIIVDNAADSGPGTLRQALLIAQPYDTITFDRSVFAPDAPTTIILSSGLPELQQGNLTIEASDAGVIIDGSHVTKPEGTNGISIASSHNVIRGLQITGFSSAGIGLRGGAQYNVIGGDRQLGEGRLGQGNLISGNGSFGIGLWDEATSYNTIRGNYIGIDINGTEKRGFIRDGIHSNGATQNLMADNVIGGNEGAGIYLCCVRDGRNTVTNNLIGVSPDGYLLSNNQAGVLIDRSSHNVIGPGNTIAHNLGDGISFREDASFTTITQNSIFANSGSSIGLPAQGSQVLPAPFLLDFDLKAGTASGIACSGCTVELFSDKGNDAEIFEVSSTADEAGTFSIHKGAAFSGPYLTTVAIDENGTTSQLALHTAGEQQSAVIQEGNSQPRSLIQIKPFDELVGNYIGDVFDGVSAKRNPLPCRPLEEVPEYAHVPKMGFTWVRLSVDRLEWWENGDPSSTHFMGEFSSKNINACQDRIISTLAEQHVTIVHTIVFWDEAVHSTRIPNYRNEAEVQGYLDYARLIVRHFKGHIQYYGILNEAMNFVDVQTYLNLVRRAISVIHEEDPEAKIVVGGTANLSSPTTRWQLEQILRSDVMPLIDAIEIHPMYGASPGGDEIGIYYRDYPDIIANFKKVAAEHGFEGIFMADEMSWSIEPNPWSWRRFNEEQAAKYYARTIVQNRGLDMWAAVGGEWWLPIATKVVHNLTTIMDGAEPKPLPVEIKSQRMNLLSYTFSLPGGEWLVALWTNNAAASYDPGVSSDLIFSGLAATRAVGIDPFIGIERNLEFQSINGDLIIRSLVVKDYPIFVRLTP